MSTLYVSSELTPPGGFTAGIEGPACDADGMLYAVNYDHQGTIGRVAPDGECSIFVELPEWSIGNGIRFHSSGDMLVADYTGHNVLRIDMQSRAISVYAHEQTMNQPNDIAIAADDTSRDVWHFVCALSPDEPHHATCTLTFESPARPEGPAWLSIHFDVVPSSSPSTWSSSASGAAGACETVGANLVGTYFYSAQTNDAGVYNFHARATRR